MSTTASATVSGGVYNTPEVNSGTTTSWLPLTDSWPSSSGCASSFFLYPGQPAPVAWDPGYGYFYGGQPRCLPPVATTWWEQNHQGGDQFTILSIRPIVCPGAFTTAATSVQSGSSTLVLCCPSGYDLLNGQPGRAVGDCWSSLTPGQTITYLASATNGVIQTSLAVNASTSISAIQMRDWNIETAVPQSSSNSPTPSTRASSSGSPAGLSTGAKAGIGVAVAIAVILILALAGALLMLRRRSRTAQHNLPVAGPPPVVQDRSEQVYEKSAVLDPTELPSKQPSIRSPLPKSPVEMPTGHR